MILRFIEHAAVTIAAAVLVGISKLPSAKAGVTMAYDLWDEAGEELYRRLDKQ